MLLETLSSSDDGLLDALLDHLTIDPSIDVATALTRVDQQCAARATGAQLEQRHTEKQQRRGADLHRRWCDLTAETAATAHATAAEGDVEALISDTAEYFAGLRSSSACTRGAAAGSGGSGGGGWRSPTPGPAASPAPALVVHTLLPLLSCLSQPSPTGAGNTENDASPLLPSLRRAYLRLLPSALRTVVSAAGPSAPPPAPTSQLDLTHPPSEAAVVAWYRRCTSEPAVRQLLAPYLTSTTEKLERELRYHFSRGRPTAALHEPQHFFTFLSDCLERQHDAHRCIWDEQTGAVARAPVPTSLLMLLDRISQLTLIAAAVSVSQSCYGWHAHSPLWRTADYVVVTVNALLDFVSRVEGRLSKEAAQLLLQRLFVAEVAQCYAAAGVTMATAALQNGTRRLWRRSFLTDNGARAISPPLYVGSLHMVRAVEALVRRLLNTLLVVDPAYAVLMWRKTIEPVLVVYLEEVEAHADGAHDVADAWQSVLTLQWCVASVQVVATAAEDWLGMLRESTLPAQAAGPTSPDKSSATASIRGGGGVLVASDALDGLVLFRDSLARRAAELAKALTRQVCTHHIGDAAQASGLLHGLDAFLQVMATLPDGSSRYVLLTVMQGVVQECLPREQQTVLADFASRSGLQHVPRLLCT